MEWVCEMQWPQGQAQGGPGVLVIRPADPDGYPAGGISQTLLREVDFKAALDTLRRQLAGSEERQKIKAASRKKMNGLLVAHSQEREITDLYLALLSRAYVAACNQGQDKPLNYLAELTGKSYSAIKNHLWQATRRGLLARSPGRAGGKVTGKAANLMADLIDSPLKPLFPPDKS
jgi:hypothetical protein